MEEKIDFRAAFCNTICMTKTISIRLDESLLRAVDRVGEGDNRRRSEIVREALELWLERRTLAEKIRRHRQGYERSPVAADEFAPVLETQIWPKSGCSALQRYVRETSVRSGLVSSIIHHTLPALSKAKPAAMAISH